MNKHEIPISSSELELGTIRTAIDIGDEKRKQISTLDTNNVAELEKVRVGVKLLDKLLTGRMRAETEFLLNSISFGCPRDLSDRNELQEEARDDESSHQRSEGGRLHERREKESFLELDEDHIENICSNLSHEEINIIEGILINSAKGVLRNLDDNKQSEKDLRRIVELFPMTLSGKCSDENLPIQSAASSKRSISFVPVLAEYGVKFNVGGIERCGGLLLASAPHLHSGQNIIQHIACQGGSKPIKVMRRLWDLNILKAEHIREYDLLFCAIQHKVEDMLNILISFEPELLKDACGHFLDRNTRSLIHYSIQERSGVCRGFGFPLTLKVGLKYFPQEFGLLFHSNVVQMTQDLKFDNPGSPRFRKSIKKSITAIDLAYESLGDTKACKTVERSLSDHFQSRIGEIDSATNLYQFMIAASKTKTSGLDLVYFLVSQSLDAFD